MGQTLSAAICALNSQYIHSSLAPWCLLAGIHAFCEKGITAEVIEGTINEDPGGIARRILENKPQVIGFSCYIWNIDATRRLVRMVKSEWPGAVIVLGGPEVSYNAADILREEPLVQYVVSGEGETPFALLLNAIFHGESTQCIPGVSCRQSGQPLSARPYISADDPPSPYSEEYFRALKGRIAYLETSRGCPYSCAFCLSGYGNVRYFDLSRAKKELLMLAGSGAQTVKLVDRTFNANRERAAALFEFVIRNAGATIPESVCFHFEIAGDILDADIINLLSTAPAGLIQLEIGLQSFNARTLTVINRKTDVGRLKNNIRKITANGNIHVHVDLIAGLPYEDLKSFAQSFNTAYELKPNMLQLGFLKLLHGCAMREAPEKYPCRYDSRAPYEVNETPWLSSEELSSLHRTEDAVGRLFNSGRFRRTLDYLLVQIGITPFELFSRFGEYLRSRDAKGISLDDYIALVFEYFGGCSGVSKMALRDVLVCDRLATNSSGRLPAALQVKDAALKCVRRKLENDHPAIPFNGGRHGMALLYAEPGVVYADYRRKDPVTGEYPLFKIPRGTFHSI